MTTVAKIGGAALQDPATLDALATAWAASDRAEPWCLVHGGGPQLDAALRAMEGPPAKVHGLRVTSHAAAETVREVLDQIGAELTAALMQRGIDAVHVPATAKRLRATVRDAGGVDIGRVGAPHAFESSGLDAPGRVHVLAPVGWDDHGPLNVNADEAARQVAHSVDARRMVLLTDVPHVRGLDGAPISKLDLENVPAFLASGAAQGGMVPKLQAAKEALEGGLREVVVGDVAALAGGGTRIGRGA